MKTLALLFCLFSISLWAEDPTTPKVPAEASAYKADEIRVYKAKRKVEMLYEGVVVKTYFPHFGRGGLKPKKQEGDLLVPEGQYLLDYKNPYSKFRKSLHINYPNEDDVRRAMNAGIDPGKDIMLHGYPNNVFSRMAARSTTDWTAGCIAVEDYEIDEIYNSLEVPTPITIYP